MKSSVVLFTLIVLNGCTGGGETVVSGFGNSGNFFGGDPEVELMAKALANYPQTPKITDEDLGKIFSVIQEQAINGDPRSAVIIYRLAARQRQAENEEKE
jgi:hypothetical protein